MNPSPTRTSPAKEQSPQDLFSKAIRDTFYLYPDWIDKHIIQPRNWQTTGFGGLFDQPTTIDDLLAERWTDYRDMVGLTCLPADCQAIICNRPGKLSYGLIATLSDRDMISLIDLDRYLDRDKTSGTLTAVRLGSRPCEATTRTIAIIKKEVVDGKPFDILVNIILGQPLPKMVYTIDAGVYGDRELQDGSMISVAQAKEFRLRHYTYVKMSGKDMPGSFPLKNTDPSMIVIGNIEDESSEAEIFQGQLAVVAQTPLIKVWGTTKASREAMFRQYCRPQNRNVNWEFARIFGTCPAPALEHTTVSIVFSEKVPPKQKQQLIPHPMAIPEEKKKEEPVVQVDFTPDQQQPKVEDSRNPSWAGFLPKPNFGLKTIDTEEDKIIKGVGPIEEST